MDGETYNSQYLSYGICPLCAVLITTCRCHCEVACPRPLCFVVFPLSLVVIGVKHFIDFLNRNPRSLRTLAPLIVHFSLRHLGFREKIGASDGTLEQIVGLFPPVYGYLLNSCVVPICFSHRGNVTEMCLRGFYTLLSE